MTVTVDPENDDPEPEDDAATTAEDTVVTIDALANDTDPDGDALTLAGVEGGEHGHASVAPGGTTLVYEPAPDYSGTDALEYAVSDGNGGEEAGEVIVEVTPVDDPPRPGSDSATVVQGGSVVVDVLANDTPGPADEAGQPLDVVGIAGPANGTTEIVRDGGGRARIRYTPTATFIGTETFTYDVSDGGSLASGQAAVRVRPATFRTLCGLPPTIRGTLGDDNLVGTPGGDVIRARRGSDVIDGNGGTDVVCGGPGADTITTGDGPDRIAGGTGPDRIESGAGPDRVRGGAGADELTTGAGADSIAAGSGAGVANAGDGTNRVKGGAGDDRLEAGDGNDRIAGGPGTDSCDAGGGRNIVLRCEDA